MNECVVYCYTTTSAVGPIVSPDAAPPPSTSPDIDEDKLN